MANIKEAAACNSQQVLRALIIVVDRFRHNSLFTHVISTKFITQHEKLDAKKEEPSSSYFPKRNGYRIPDEFKLLENGDKFLLCDEREHDIDRILVFSTEPDFDGLMKYKD